jgi:hypothetical protein
VQIYGENSGRANFFAKKIHIFSKSASECILKGVGKRRNFDSNCEIRSMGLLSTGRKISFGGEICPEIGPRTSGQGLRKLNFRKPARIFVRKVGGSPAVLYLMPRFGG